MARHSSLSEQLSAKRGNLKNNQGESSPFKYFNALPRVPTPHTDGVDHINISNRARAEIGEVLWIESLLPFNHDIIGRCTSVAAGWDFLTTGCLDPSLRTAPRSGRRRVVEELRNNENTRFTMNHGNFIFIDLLWSQIMQIPRLKEELLKTSLPFDCYQLEGELNLPFRSRISRRVVESMEFVRSAILNNQVPDAKVITNGKTRMEVYGQFKREEVVYANEPAERKNSLMEEISMSVTSRARKRVVAEIKNISTEQKQNIPEKGITEESKTAETGSTMAELHSEVQEDVSSVEPQVETPAEQPIEEPVVDLDTEILSSRIVGFVVHPIGLNVEITTDDQFEICSHLVLDETGNGFESPLGWKTVSSYEDVDFTVNAVSHAFVCEGRVNSDNQEEVGFTVVKFDASQPFDAEAINAFSNESLILVDTSQEEVENQETAEQQETTNN